MDMPIKYGSYVTAWRRIILRYEKITIMYIALIKLACIMIYLRYTYKRNLK
ncbi:MAG: hypothetical protein QW272_07605 [Candidatus Methanomethylicaceae archaeon]